MSKKEFKGQKKINGFVEEFKKFIMRGNVMDMAVGVIIGGAFTSVVTSLNKDIISPILGIFGGVDFSDMAVSMNGSMLKYGSFITAVINFLITSFVIFCLIKVINTVSDKLSRKKEEEPAPTTQKCPFCKTDIAIDATRCPNCTSLLDEVDPDCQ